MVVWTSNESSRRKTFYSIVNETIRADKKSTILTLSARFCRSLNFHLVLRDNPTALEEVQWPDTVFRGTWMPQDQVKWYLERSTEHFRAVQLVATSDSPVVANKFLANYNQSHFGYIPVRFEISMASHPIHARLLDDISAMQGEREWLFPPYSSFQVAERRLNVLEICMTVLTHHYFQRPKPDVW